MNENSEIEILTTDPDAARADLKRLQARRSRLQPLIANIEDDSKELSNFSPPEKIKEDQFIPPKLTQRKVQPEDSQTLVPQKPSGESIEESLGYKKGTMSRKGFVAMLGGLGFLGGIWWLGGGAIRGIQGKDQQVAESIKKLLEDPRFSEFLQKLNLSPKDDKLSDPAQKIGDGALYIQTCLNSCDQVNWDSLVVYAEKGSDEDFLGQLVVLQGANTQKTNYLNADKTINKNSLIINGLNDETKARYIKAFNDRVKLLKEQGKYKAVIP